LDKAFILTMEKGT